MNGSHVCQKGLIFTPGSCKNTPKTGILIFDPPQSQVSSYSIWNMGFRWPILHQSWVQTSYKGLENNLSNLHVNVRLDSDTRKLKIHHNVGKLTLIRGSKSQFLLFFLNILFFAFIAPILSRNYYFNPENN